jgi:hypothetical protein
MMDFGCGRSSLYRELVRVLWLWRTKQPNSQKNNFQTQTWLIVGLFGYPESMFGYPESKEQFSNSDMTHCWIVWLSWVNVWLSWVKRTIFKLRHDSLLDCLVILSQCLVNLSQSSKDRSWHHVWPPDLD